MPGTSKSAQVWRKPANQAGVAAVEVALLALIFFIVVFGAIEIIRVVYINNTMFDASRRAARAAALVSADDLGSLAGIRNRVIFRTTAGELPFGMPVSTQHIRIDYLALVRNGSADPVLTPIAGGALPSCLANRRICLADPNAANCIRFVRVRFCATDGGDACNPLRYEPLVPLIPMPISLPSATSINVVESFGTTTAGVPCAQAGLC